MARIEREIMTIADLLLTYEINVNGSYDARANDLQRRYCDGFHDFSEVIEYLEDSQGPLKNPPYWLRPRLDHIENLMNQFYLKYGHDVQKLPDMLLIEQAEAMAEMAESLEDPYAIGYLAKMLEGCKSQAKQWAMEEEQCEERHRRVQDLLKGVENDEKN